MQARHALWFTFFQANAMVGDLLVERIRFRHIAALIASTQLRLIVRAWRQQVTTHSLEYALRCVRRASELASQAHEEKVEALLHLEQILGFRDDFNPT